jgi:hypothetical protein
MSYPEAPQGWTYDGDGDELYPLPVKKAQAPMTEQASREYVEARWSLTVQCDGSYRHYVCGTVLIQEKNHQFWDFASWQAAKDFTVEREKQIAEVNEEITYINTFIKTPSGSPHPVWTRIIESRKTALADLKRGMR